MLRGNTSLIDGGLTGSAVLVRWPLPPHLFTTEEDEWRSNMWDSSSSAEHVPAAVSLFFLFFYFALGCTHARHAGSRLFLPCDPIYSAARPRDHLFPCPCSLPARMCVFSGRRAARVHVRVCTCACFCVLQLLLMPCVCVFRLFNPGLLMKAFSLWQRKKQSSNENTVWHSNREHGVHQLLPSNVRVNLMSRGKQRQLTTWQLTLV